MARFQYVRDTVQELYVQTYGSIGDSVIVDIGVLRQTTAPQVNDGGGVQWSATATTLAFDSLVGTLPPSGVILCGTEKIQYGGITWTSTVAGSLTSCKRGWEGTTAAAHVNNTEFYVADAFAWINTAVTNVATTIPFVNLDRPGCIPETGVVYVQSEWIWYGGVTYTNAEKTAGNLLYCFRGYNDLFTGSTKAAHDGSTTNIPIRFEHIFAHREGVRIYNYMTSPDILYYGFNPTIANTGTNALPIAFGANAEIAAGPRIRCYVLAESGATGGTVAIAEWR